MRRVLNIIILMIVKFSLATLAVRLFAFFVGRYHRLRLVGQVALLRLVPKLHNHADDALDDLYIIGAVCLSVTKVIILPNETF